ncbi:MAG: hypothetical protein H7Y20_09630 [Bryobacteraceae bacterium]|nr:hypothetical protein [Bryobacteraceae bacterium]
MAWLLNLEMAATFYLTGVIWVIQLVHYPMLGKVGETFDDCQKFHLSRMGMVVAIPMLTEGFCASFLLAQQVSNPLKQVGFALLVVIWASTFLLQVPQHHSLDCGFDRRVHSRLVDTNWIRTIAWTARSALLLWTSIK